MKFVNKILCALFIIITISQMNSLLVEAGNTTIIASQQISYADESRLSFQSDETEITSQAHETEFIVPTSTTLPTNEQWAELSLEEKAHTIVSTIYLNANTENSITEEQIQVLLGEPDEVFEMNDQIKQHLFTLEDGGRKIALKLAYDLEKKTYFEGLGEQSFELDTPPVTFDKFDELASLLRENYQDKQHTKVEVLADYLESPKSVSYIFDAIVYQFPGENHDKYAVTVKENIITDINYLSGDQASMKQPIEQTKKQLDRLAHEAGLNHQEILSILGQPHSINYDSKSGIITNAWFSTSETSAAKEVYYYYAYNGISIGLAYGSGQEVEN